jgi:hypothetical protein
MSISDLCDIAFGLIAALVFCGVLVKLAEHPLALLCSVVFMSVICIQLALSVRAIP